MRKGKQALILLPEIALTAQFLTRFAQRFGVPPAQWHSEVAPRLRARTWAGGRAMSGGNQQKLVVARRILRSYERGDGWRFH